MPDHVANRLRTYLDAYTSPRHGPLGDIDRLTTPRRRGEAFCALLENLPADALPQHGGTATTVMVILDFDTLRTGVGFGRTSTGDMCTAEQARRFACQANVQGGKTDLADGKLLCPFHHHRAHDPGWEVHHPPNGSTTFHRRT